MPEQNNCFGPKEERLKVSSQLESMTPKSINQDGNLGVVLDSGLNFNSHTKTITKSVFCRLKNMARSKRLLSRQDKETFAPVCIFRGFDDNN